jgi:hypothetical protein
MRLSFLLLKEKKQVRQAEKNLARKPELDALQRELQNMSDELEMLKET